MAEQDTIVRAFALARGGSCRNMNDIRRELKIEGCGNVDAHLTGLGIKKQLMALMKQ